MVGTVVVDTSVVVDGSGMVVGSLAVDGSEPICSVLSGLFMRQERFHHIVGLPFDFGIVAADWHAPRVAVPTAGRWDAVLTLPRRPALTAHRPAPTAHRPALTVSE
jgi:hypothetical protein